MFFSPQRKINGKILTEGVFFSPVLCSCRLTNTVGEVCRLCKSTFFSSWLPYSADSYNLDLSVVFHDKYQGEIWKNTAGKFASLLVAHFSKLVLQRFVDIVLLQENSPSSLKSRWNMKIEMSNLLETVHEGHSVPEEVIRAHFLPYLEKSKNVNFLLINLTKGRIQSLSTL